MVNLDITKYKDFEKINQEIEDVDARYKNPRNLCSGSVRQLNNQITAKRNVMFYAFTLVQADGVDFQNSRACQMEWLKSQGFTTVEYYMVTRDTVEDEVAKFSSKISENDFPSDGLVLTYDDIINHLKQYKSNQFTFFIDEFNTNSMNVIDIFTYNGPQL